MSLFTTKHKRFSLTTLQQLFFRKLSIYFIRDVASVCSCYQVRSVKIVIVITRHESSILYIYLVSLQYLQIGCVANRVRFLEELLNE